MILLMHVFNAIYLTISNNKASSNKYDVSITQTSTLNSRTMIVSGFIILLFFNSSFKIFLVYIPNT